jgi:hypothetical protein
VLTAYDLGKTMAVRVTGSKTGYTTASKTSASTAAVAPGVLSAPTPTISGTRKVGYVLTAVPGTWGPGAVGLRYQWYRSGTAITGATAATYKLSVWDAGKVITVKVTGTKTGYTTATKTSAGTAPVVPLTLTSTPVPTISGTAKVGNRLTANAGTWGPAPVTLQYQWYRSGIAVPGSNAATYVLHSWDTGKVITVKVTGRKTGYGTVVKTSAPTAAVTAYIRISRDGAWQVPNGVPRNTYVTTSKATKDCYWETNTSFQFPNETMVGWGWGNGQRIMEVPAAASVVGTDQCGSWIRLADMPKAQKTTIAGDGVWSVAKQIVPGRYRASRDVSGRCTFGFSDDFAFSDDSDLHYYYTYGPFVEVSLYASDVSFDSDGCGSWTRVGDPELREAGARVADDSRPMEAGTHRLLNAKKLGAFSRR